jgi:hypothetical protein
MTLLPLYRQGGISMKRTPPAGFALLVETQ